MTASLLVAVSELAGAWWWRGFVSVLAATLIPFALIGDGVLALCALARTWWWKTTWPDAVSCPNCASRVELVGWFRCPTCKSAMRDHAWSPCSVCGDAAGASVTCACGATCPAPANVREAS